MTRDRNKQLKSRLHHLHQQAIRAKWRLENITRTRERLDAEERSLIADAIRISRAIDACEAGQFRRPPVPIATGTDHERRPEHAPEVVATQVDSSADHSDATGSGLRTHSCVICGGPAINGPDGNTVCRGSYHSAASSPCLRPALCAEPTGYTVARERDEGQPLEPGSTGDV